MSLIVGTSSVVNVTDFPYYFLFLTTFATGHWKSFCGGSFIDKHWGVTAAHCITTTVNNTYILTGITNLTDVLSRNITTIKKWNLTKIIVHENYNPYDNDIALLHFSETLPKPYLSLNNITNYEKETTELSIIGYGTKHTYLNDYSDQLLIGNVFIDDSKKYPNVQITDNMLLASNVFEGTDSCQGDSGSPMYDIITKTLVGLVSWGNGCGDPYNPGVYTKVSNYVKWISKHLDVNI
jgi:secreted trypsin-like serine protease